MTNELMVLGVAMEHVREWLWRGRVGELDVEFTIDAKTNDSIATARKDGIPIAEERADTHDAAARALSSFLVVAGFAPAPQVNEAPPAAQEGPTMTETETAPTTTQAATPPAADVRLIDEALIDEHPDNPRKTFSPEALDELAQSIRTVGLIHPVNVRPREGGRFEMICGARRLRACRLAGLSQVLCIVRDTSDADALEAMLVENSQREDVHPLEEADGYVAWNKKLKRSPEEISARTGRSIRHVFYRLQLAKLRKPARDAFLAGLILTAVAEALARIEGEEQDRALEHVLPFTRWNGTEHVRDSEPRSIGECRNIILRHLAIPLKSAPFDTTDATLVKKAGACTGCPRRAGNSPMLFDDVQDEDTCTLRSCYEKKVAAASLRLLEAARERGLTVLEPKAATELFGGGSKFAGQPMTKEKSELVLLDEHTERFNGRSPTWLKVLGDRELEPTHAALDPDGFVVELYSRAALEQIAKERHVPLRGPRERYSSGPRETPAKKAERLLEERIEKETAKGLAEALVEAAEQEYQTGDAFLALTVTSLAKAQSYFLEGVARRRGLKGGPGVAIAKYTKTLTAVARAGLLVEMLHAIHARPAGGMGCPTSPLLAAFKVPVKKIEASVRRAVEPPEVKPRANKAKARKARK